MISQYLYKTICICVLLVGLTFSKAHAQTLFDSTGARIDSTSKANVAIDTAKNVHSPHKAALRSAILPGWGQVYNRKYWKVPIIYAALGTTAYVFYFNLNTYKDMKFAYSARYKAELPNPDSTDYFKLKPIYQNPNVSSSSIKYNRDEFRRYVDYSVLVFAALWGLNIIDASVDAHLKSFDVSPDLGLHFRAGYSDLARTNGFSIILAVK